MNDSFKPGQVWKDTEGKVIQAHGFSVLYEDGWYYWYGENKENTKPFQKIWTWGIRCYRSEDLYNWEDLGLIVSPEPDDRQSPMHPNNCIDRPHILFCKNTGKYVMWIKVMCGLVSQFMCVMEADKITGPYHYVHKYYHPLGMDTGDFSFCEKNGTAYLIFERPHFQLITAELNESYTEATGKYSTNFNGLYPPFTREAPAYFEKDGQGYLFTSGTSGYYPNASKVAKVNDMLGTYEDLGFVHENDVTRTSFNSQISSVLTVQGTGLQIALADRWKPGRKSALKTKVMEKYYQHMFRNYTPDLSEKKTERLQDEKRRFYEDTSKSRYVWLPIEWEKDKPVIRWYDEWRLEDFCR